MQSRLLTEIELAGDSMGSGPQIPILSIIRRTVAGFPHCHLFTFAKPHHRNHQFEKLQCWLLHLRLQQVLIASGFSFLSKSQLKHCTYNFLDLVSSPNNDSTVLHVHYRI
ncbi:hypothetical protein L1887_02979 [Cichorium endivia]|nr:hypothetical protein L1887_02979 [Cichorium endivia]